MEYEQLLLQRRNHPAWRLLAADNAPMIASFLHRSFIVSNVRTVSRQQLSSLLDDYLYHLHETAGEVIFPKPAATYLDDWASDDKGWLRKYYPPGQDDAHFDLTSSTEMAIEWLNSLGGLGGPGRKQSPPALRGLFPLPTETGDGPNKDKPFMDMIATFALNSEQTGFLTHSVSGDGTAIDGDGQMEDGKLVFAQVNGPNLFSRYTIEVKDGVWKQKGELTDDGKRYFTFMEMTLKKSP